MTTMNKEFHPDVDTIALQDHLEDAINQLPPDFEEHVNSAFAEVDESRRNDKNYIRQDTENEIFGLLYDVGTLMYDIENKIKKALDLTVRYNEKNTRTEDS